MVVGRSHTGPLVAVVEDKTHTHMEALVFPIQVEDMVIPAVLQIQIPQVADTTHQSLKQVHIMGTVLRLVNQIAIGMQQDKEVIIMVAAVVLLVEAEAMMGSRGWKATSLTEPECATCSDNGMRQRHAASSPR